MCSCTRLNEAWNDCDFSLSRNWLGVPEADFWSAWLSVVQFLDCPSFDAGRLLRSILTRRPVTTNLRNRIESVHGLPRNPAELSRVAEV